MPRLSKAQRQALGSLGIDPRDFRPFMSGVLVPFEFAAEKSRGIGLACKEGHRIRSGILLLNDPGGGRKTLSWFRTASRAVAVAFRAKELELFGAAVTNPKLRNLLLRQSFVVGTISLEARLGGGELEIISRVFSVK